jgi:hypothetical protein
MDFEEFTSGSPLARNDGRCWIDRWGDCFEMLSSDCATIQWHDRPWRPRSISKGRGGTETVDRQCRRIQIPVRSIPPSLRECEREYIGANSSLGLLGLWFWASVARSYESV